MDNAPGSDQLRKSPLFLAGAPSVEAAFTNLFELDAACATCISSVPPGLATRHPDHPAIAILAPKLGNLGRNARVLTPPSKLRLLVPRPGDLIFVNVSGRGARLGKVGYAKRLFESEILYAFTDLDALRGPDPEMAIGLWRSYVSNLARLGRHLGEEGAELTVELSLGITCRRYFLSATIDGLAVAISTWDPIIAELAGRAILQLKSGSLDDLRRGPWEAPIVQRAGELKLGVRTPDQIEVTHRWSGGANEARFASFLERFADRLSITL